MWWHKKRYLVALIGNLAVFALGTPASAYLSQLSFSQFRPSTIDIDWVAGVFPPIHLTPNTRSGVDTLRGWTIGFDEELDPIIVYPSSGSGSDNVWSFTDIHGSIGNYYIDWQYTNPILSFSTFWTVKPRVVIEPNCISNQATCQPITGYLPISWKNGPVAINPRTPAIERGAPIGTTIPLGSSSRVPENMGYTLSIQPDGLPAELQRIYELDFFTSLDSSGVPILGVDLELGRLSSQDSSFNLLIEYDGASCVIDSFTTACSDAFAASVSSALVDPSKWSLNHDIGAFVSLVPIDFPRVTASYAGSSNPTAAILIDQNLQGEAKETEVPGPLPLLGLGAAFGYSRKLRKRIKTSKTPEIMSTNG
jgi:hypothetical protein